MHLQEVGTKKYPVDCKNKMFQRIDRRVFLCTSLFIARLFFALSPFTFRITIFSSCSIDSDSFCTYFSCSGLGVIGGKAGVEIGTAWVVNSGVSCSGGGADDSSINSVGGPGCWAAIVALLCSLLSIACQNQNIIKDIIWFSSELFYIQNRNSCVTVRYMHDSIDTSQFWQLRRAFSFFFYFRWKTALKRFITQC